MKLYDEIVRDEYGSITERYVVLNFKESEENKANFIMNEIYDSTGFKFEDCGMESEIEWATDWETRDDLKEIKDAYRDAKKEWKQRNKI